MPTSSEISRLKSQLVNIEKLLREASGHPFMEESLRIRQEILIKKLEEYPEYYVDPTIQLLFSGEAVFGSKGIKSSFITKITNPLENLIKTQSAVVRFGKVGKRGRAKRGIDSELFITALPTGSFGIELQHLDQSDLFEGENVQEAMNQVIGIIEDTAAGDDDFERIMNTIPMRNLNNLRKFLGPIRKHKSMLIIESKSSVVELSKEDVDVAYSRVASTESEVNENFIPGILRGILLDSAKFEMQDSDGMKIQGLISPDLSEETLVEYERQYLNRPCTFHIQINHTKFVTGSEITSYELLEILPEKDVEKT